MPPVASAICLSIVSSRRDFTNCPDASFTNWVPPVLVHDRDQFAVRAADADGENLQAVLRRRARRVQRAAFEVFAVGEQHEDALVVAVAFQRGFGFVDGRGDVRAAARNDLRVQRVERLAEGVVVERERALQKRIAGERRSSPTRSPSSLREQILDGHLARG